MSRRVHFGPETRVALGASLLGLAVAAVPQVRRLRAAHAATSTRRSREDLGETHRRGTTDDARLGLQAAGRAVPRRNVFIAHAHEDKRAIARPLAEQLRARGCSVWFDEYDIVLGDSLRTQIGDGLLHCQLGVVILSHSFFENQWSRWELDGLLARHIAGERNVILPVWHGLTLDDIRLYSPPLADLRAARSSDGAEAIADAVVRVLIRHAGKARLNEQSIAAPSLSARHDPRGRIQREHLLPHSLHGGRTIRASDVTPSMPTIPASAGQGQPHRARSTRRCSRRSRTAPSTQAQCPARERPFSPARRA